MLRQLPSSFDDPNSEQSLFCQHLKEIGSRSDTGQVKLFPVLSLSALNIVEVRHDRFPIEVEQAQ